MSWIKRVGFLTAFIIPALTVLGFYLGDWWNYTHECHLHQRAKFAHSSVSLVRCGLRRASSEKEGQNQQTKTKAGAITREAGIATIDNWPEDSQNQATAVFQGRLEQGEVIEPRTSCFVVVISHV